MRAVAHLPLYLYAIQACGKTLKPAIAVPTPGIPGSVQTATVVAVSNSNRGLCSPLDTNFLDP